MEQPIYIENKENSIDFKEKEIIDSVLLSLKSYEISR